MENISKNDKHEINLYELWKMTVKRIKLIIGICLLFVIAALILSQFMPRIYRGDAVLRMPTFELAASNVTTREVIDLIGAIDEKKNLLLPKTYALITNIKLTPLKDSKDKIAISIEALDTNAIQPALSEVIDFINNVDDVKKLVKEEQDKLSKKSNELASVLAASSGLLRTYSNLLKEGKLIPVGFNPIDLNKKIYDIKMEKLLADQALMRLNGGADIAKQLYIGKNPISPKPIKNMVLAGIMSLIAGFSLSLYLDYREKKRNTV